MLYLLAIFMVLPACLCNLQPPPINPGSLTQSKSMGQCQACKLFMDSLQKNIERTSLGYYEGENAAQQKDKLRKSFKHTESRFIDIQDGLCKEKKEHSNHCRSMYKKVEEMIEEWWFDERSEEPVDLYKHFCIKKLKFCCPKHHYGKACRPCPTYHSKVCSDNGKCRGDGTRKGNGTCLCDKGYSGNNCDDCAPGYYLSYKDDNKMLCSLCHESCLGGCRNGSHKDCIACKAGFQFDVDAGCLDKNECEDKNACSKNQFCLNSPGSYTCLDCDKSCAGCHGDGPDMCRKCAIGYSKKGEFCIADRKDEDPSDKLTSTRLV